MNGASSIATIKRLRTLRDLRLNVKVSLVLPGGRLPPDHRRCLGASRWALQEMTSAPDLVTVKAADGEVQLRAEGNESDSSPKTLN